MIVWLRAVQFKAYCFVIKLLRRKRYLNLNPQSELKEISPSPVSLYCSWHCDWRCHALPHIKKNFF